MLLFICLFSFLLNPDTLVLKDRFGSFQKASSVSVSREKFIFVSDPEVNRIYKYSASGTKLLTFGGPGFSSSQLNKPVSIDASNGLDVFVCDYQNNRVQRYDLNLNLMATFDFNVYNQTAETSKRILYPSGMAFLNTSEIFVIADAGNFKIAKLKSLDEVNLLFGSSYGIDRIVSPKKIIKGDGLNLFILDGESSILKYDNFGTFVYKIENKEKVPVISIAFYNNDNLFILYSNQILIYNTKLNQYSSLYKFDLADLPADISVINEKNILILTEKKVYNFINN